MTTSDDLIFFAELTMLSALLYAGLYLSYTDLTIRMVPNRYTFGLLLFGLVGQTIMVQLGVVTAGAVLALAGTALAIAFGLMLYGFWAPGDAKFFWASVVALPPTLSATNGVLSLHATPWALILNALACYLIVLLLVPFWRRRHWRSIGEAEPVGARQIAMAAAGLGGIMGLTLGFSHLAMSRPLSYLETFGILVIGYRLADKWIKSERWPLFVLPGVAVFAHVALVFGGGADYLKLVAVAWGIEVLYLFVRRWHSRAYVQSFPVRYLRPGAILRERLQVATADGGGFVSEGGKPLTEQEYSKLRSLVSRGKLSEDDAVAVEQAIPFVPVITFAVVLTAYFAGNLVPPLVRLMAWMEG